jgi:hypothetical protein
MVSFWWWSVNNEGRFTWRKSNFIAVFQLPFEWFYSKSTTRTLHALPANDFSLIAIGQKGTAIFLEYRNFTALSQLAFRGISWNPERKCITYWGCQFGCDRRIAKGTLLVIHITFTEVSWFLSRDFSEIPHLSQWVLCLQTPWAWLQWPINRGTLHGTQSNFTAVYRFPLEGFSWNPTSFTPIVLPRNGISSVAIGHEWKAHIH